jgi:hypothetical protein
MRNARARREVGRPVIDRPLLNLVGTTGDAPAGKVHAVVTGAAAVRGAGRGVAGRDGKSNRDCF